MSQDPYLEGAELRPTPAKRVSLFRAGNISKRTIIEHQRLQFQSPYLNMAAPN